MQDVLAQNGINTTIEKIKIGLVNAPPHSSYDALKTASENAPHKKILKFNRELVVGIFSSLAAAAIAYQAGRLHSVKRPSPPASTSTETDKAENSTSPSDAREGILLANKSVVNLFQENKAYIVQRKNGALIVTQVEISAVPQADVKRTKKYKKTKSSNYSELKKQSGLIATPDKGENPEVPKAESHGYVVALRSNFKVPMSRYATKLGI